MCTVEYSSLESGTLGKHLPPFGDFLIPITNRWFRALCPLHLKGISGRKIAAIWYHKRKQERVASTLRLWIAVLAARMVGWVSRLTGRGGSSLPGIIARKIDPHALIKLTRRIDEGVVLVTGTNGKTTTSALASRIVRHAGKRLIHNPSGANLILGLTATLAQAQPDHIVPRADLAVLETDEASVPRAAEEIRPRMMVVTNVFRDQLDRYGELTTTVKMIQDGLARMSEDGIGILNADDPQVAHLGEDVARPLYFGLELDVGGVGGRSVYDVADARLCPRCGQALIYSVRYYAHIGHYRCPGCGWQRPRPDVSLVSWQRTEQVVEIETPTGTGRFPAELPGIYNLYNLLAAVSLGSALGISNAKMAEAVRDFRAAFGRMEKIVIDGREIRLALVKNPVGFNQVLATMADDARALSGMIVINDGYADGRDVSWLWDVDFEGWLPRVPVERWWISGSRAYDMAVRMKYAGVPEAAITVEENVVRAFAGLMAQSNAPIYILPTYTALMELREHLTHRGVVAHFREG